MLRQNLICALLLLLSIIFKHNVVYSQEKTIIDQVVAIVGSSVILESDVHHQMKQYEAQGIDLGANPMCEVFEEALYQKLLYNQAVVDSIEVSEDQVEMVLERRLRYFIQQIGSRERLEAYYGKSIPELKDDFRDIIREQELSNAMEAEITRNARVTPSEVKRFYNNIPEDSIPIVESRMEMAHIVKIPPVRDEEIEDIKRRLNEYRERVLTGENFSTLAIMYSDDPGSARQGGELGFMGRGELYHDFEAVAFSLRPGEVSEVFETQAGYHIIQMIERRGEQVNVRHILLQPQISPEDIQKTKNRLDSIRSVINDGEMSFGEAAREFSDDPNKVNDGVIINPHTQTTKFRSEEMQQDLFFVVDRLEVGGISQPVAMMTDDGEQAFRIIKLLDRTEPQRANLKNNYDYIQEMALQEKQRRVIKEWVENRIETTYLRINEKYSSCEFSHGWIKDFLSEE